jgi:hypothetical protein
MPFLDSELYRGVYDIKDGGPAVGFRCMKCRKLTNSVSGMLQHLERVHEVKIQTEISLEEAKPTEL